jgi:hypothetical protein
MARNDARGMFPLGACDVNRGLVCVEVWLAETYAMGSLCIGLFVCISRLA